MADACYAFCSPSLPQPSSPSGDKDANEDEKFEETELFNDTLVLNSPFTETQVEDLKLNTALVEDSDPGEDMPSGPTCEYGDEVVLDSEDEEMDSGVAVTAGKGLLDDRTSPTVRIPSIRFQKRQLKPPYEQADSNATFRKAASGDKGVAVDAKSFNDKNHICLPEGLNHIHSPEPGDPTQAALGFVDRYLSSDNVDLFQEIQYRKTTREKSPLVPKAWGSLRLARKVEARTQNGEETFRFVDSDENDIGVGIFCKKTDTSSNFGSFRQTYMRTRQREGGHLQNQGICSTGNRRDENLVHGPEMVTKNISTFKELNVQSSVTGENVNAHSCLTHSEDMLDIGFDTQIAAEAMEALAFVPPTGCRFDDAHQPENELDGSLSILTENEAHLKNSSHGENSALHSITTKSKKRNVLSCSFSKVTSSSSSKRIESPERNPVSGKMQKKTKSKSTFEGQFESNTTSPIFTEPVSLEEVCSTGEYVSFQTAAKETKNQNKSGGTRIRGQPSLHTKMNKNVKVEDGTIRHKRKGADLAADPLKLSIRAKRLKRPTNSSGVARENKLNHQVQFSPQLSASSSLLRNDSWVYPKRARGKRKQANVQNNLDAPKEKNVYPTKSLGGQDDEDRSCFPHTLPLCEASSDDSDRCLLMGMMPEAQPGSADDAMKFGKPHDTHALLLARVGISSNKWAAQSSSEIPASISSNKGVNFSNANHTYNDHHKKPCDKNMPKFSLLKELISLGVSEPMSNLIWKDLRQRRDMTFVRVLLSQHLDDSVVKKQKKILTRLNISIASSSMEATHFIADKFIRTKNMLETMALGKLVVTHLWLESCKQANCFIDEKSYILRDAKKEKEIGFCMPVSLDRAKQNPLLKGKRVYITPHIKPDKEVIANLVTAVHGQVVDECQICADKDDKILDDLLILSCEDDCAICESFLKRGATVYGSELLLNGIVIQKLELERHQLFKDQATRNGPTTYKGKVYRRRSRPASAT